MELRTCCCLASTIAALSIGAAQCCAYSELSHEALVDALWDVSLRPALLARFPNASREQLKEAHGYAYGGSVIQDIGFYPHGNGYFSDLTHYVRPSDFIAALISDASTLDELAFALGALSHYAGDNDGHRLGTNIAEPFEYPKMRRKYGSFITYADNPENHIRTEFGFDVVEVARGNYGSQAYHDFIGFYVASPLLKRAFRETYGFEVTDMMTDFDEAIGSYRRDLSKLIPLATRIAWAEHEGDIRRARPGITKRQFLFVMSRSSYERSWGKDYQRPSIWDRILACLLKLLPPIGPLKTLHYKNPSPHVEQIFMASFDVATRTYHATIDDARRRSLHLPNKNLDVGVVTGPAQYTLQDDGYAYWLDHLAKNNFAGVTPVIADDLLAYYSNLNLPFHTKKNKKEWRQLLQQLQKLKAKRGALRASDARQPNSETLGEQP